MCPASFATIGCAVADSVSLVVFGCVPPKVFKAVIGWVPIVMAPFHAIWAWPPKCEQDQAMNFHKLTFVVFPKHYAKSWRTTAERWFFDGSFCVVNYIAKIRNLVNSFVSGYVSPLFHNVPISNYGEFYHG